MDGAADRQPAVSADADQYTCSRLATCQSEPPHVKGKRDNVKGKRDNVRRVTSCAGDHFYMELQRGTWPSPSDVADANYAAVDDPGAQMVALGGAQHVFTELSDSVATSASDLPDYASLDYAQVSPPTRRGTADHSGGAISMTNESYTHAPVIPKRMNGQSPAHGIARRCGDHGARPNEYAPETVGRRRETPLYATVPAYRNTFHSAAAGVFLGQVQDDSAENGPEYRCGRL